MSEEPTILAYNMGSAWDHYQHRKHIPDFVNRLNDPNKTCWVRISDPTSARKGSIGIAVPVGFNKDDTSTWPAPKLLPQNAYSYQYSGMVPRRVDIYLGEGKTVMSYNYGKPGLEWLPAYTGPQTWSFVRGDGSPKKLHYDALGDEIKLGDFGCYADTDGTLYFGTVTKIPKSGAIYVTNIKTDKRRSHEFRLRRGDQFARMTKDIFSRLMLLKLEQ